MSSESRISVTSQSESSMPHGLPNRIAEYLDGSQWTQSEERSNVMFVLLENLKRPPNLCTDIFAPCRLMRARHRSVQSDKLCRCDSAPENGEFPHWASRSTSGSCPTRCLSVRSPNRVEKRWRADSLPCVVSSGGEGTLATADRSECLDLSRDSVLRVPISDRQDG